MTTRSTIRRRGASAVEFALAFPFVVLMLVASADFAMWSFARQAVSRSVQDGAREASRLTLPADATDSAPLTNLARNTTTTALSTWGLNAGAATITTSWLPDASTRYFLRVRASVPYRSFFGVASPFDGPVVKEFVLYTQEQTPPGTVVP